MNKKLKNCSKFESKNSLIFYNDFDRQSLNDKLFFQTDMKISLINFNRIL